MKKKKIFNLIILTIAILAVGIGVWQINNKFNISLNKDKLITCKEHIDKNEDMFCDVCKVELPFSNYAEFKKVEAQTTNNNSVEISGYMPKNSEANITRISDSEAKAIAQRYKNISEENVVSGFDISINSKNIEYQPADYSQKLDVTISNLELDTSKTYALLHIIDENNYEILKVNNVTENEITFTASRFSTYIIITVGTNTITFDGENFRVLDSNGNEITNGATVASGTDFSFSIVPNNYYGVTEVSCSNSDAMVSVGDIKGKTCHISTVSENLTISATTVLAPSITTQPVSMKVEATATATFTVTAENATTYTWQYRENEDTYWKDVTSSFGSGYNTATFSLTNTILEVSGYEFRCLVGNENFTNHERVASDIVRVSVAKGETVVGEIPIIMTQPNSDNAKVKVNSGCGVYSVTAMGGSDMTFTWEYRENENELWKSMISGVGSATLSTPSNSTTAKPLKTSTLTTVNATYQMSGYQFRCLVGNSFYANHDAVKSDIVTLSVADDDIIVQGQKVNLKITKQPETQKVVLGQSATFSVTAEYASGYQWQYLPKGKELWVDVTSSMTSTYNKATMTIDTSSITVDDDLNTLGDLDGALFRCVITSSEVSKYTKKSDVAALSVAQDVLEKDVEFTNIIQPEDVTTFEGKIATFTAGLGNGGNGLNYEWHEVIGGVDTNLVEQGPLYMSTNRGQANSTSNGKIVIKASGTTTVSFDYKVSSEANNDKFTITVEDKTGTTTVANQISGIKDWVTYINDFTANDDGEIVLNLTYSKNDTIDEGEDAGYIRNLKATALKVVDSVSTFEDDDIYEFTNPDTSTYSSAMAWSATTIDGVLTLQSTNAGVSSSYSVATILMKNIPAAGTLSFEYRASSESANYDYFQANLIDANGDVQLFKIGGTGTVENWTNYSGSVTPDADGNVKLTLLYRKDGSVNKGDDLGAIRNLKINAERSVLTNSTFENDDIFNFDGDFKKVEYIGANTNTLTIVGELVTLAKSGAKYYCDIGGLKTDMATLTVKEYTTPKLMERESSDYINGGSVYYAIGAKRSENTKYTADLISSITFVENTNVPSEAEASWDASYTSGDMQVIAWVVPNGDLYDLYIGADDTIIEAPEDSSKLFGNYKKCTQINNIEMLDTSKVTDMSSMFSVYTNLTSLDLSNFDTSSVTNMSYMFYRSSLTSLDLSNFDTSNVTNMSYMFDNCRNLISLDLSTFKTSNVTNMSCMFDFCTSLISLDLSNFDTSSVTNMSHMFYYCSSLTSLDVSGFDTSSVTTMMEMFCYCLSLTSLDLSNFDTSNITNMYNMFFRCEKLTNIDISKFNTSKVTNMSHMFSGCYELTSLDVSSFDTSKVTDMESMFYGCKKLTNIDVSKFNTSNVTNMNYMFWICTNLKSINLGANFDKLTGKDMFYACSSLTAIITPRTEILTLNDEATTSTRLKTLKKAVLYVPNTTAEATFEADANYMDIFGADRIRPILEVNGENPVTVKVGATYDETVDAGATVAGFTKENASEYTQYGYNYTTSGLPVDTSTIGTKQVTYILTKNNGTSITNGMTTTRDVEVEALTGFEATIPSNIYEYTGAEIKPEPTVKFGDKTLTKGSDYTVNYTSNVNVGTATVTITGIGIYTGTVEKTFEITKRTIIVTSNSATKVYDSNALTNSSYTITGSGLAQGHMATVTIIGSQTDVGSSPNTISSVVIKDASGNNVTGNYDITKVNGTLEVTSKSISGLDATLSETEVEYDGTAKEPTVTVKDGNKTLVAETDYTVNYTSNTNTGTATVTITGKGNYEGEIKKTFEITKKKITVTSSNASKVYDGTALTNNNYTITESGLATGHTATVTITGSQTNVGSSPNTISTVVIKDASGTNVTANYNVTKVNGTLTVTAQEASNIKVDLSQNSFEYDGTAKEPTVTVTNTSTNKTLVKETDYSVSYTNNINAGSNTAKVVITLKGNYSGTITKTFTVTQRTITITAGSASKVYDGNALTNNTYTIGGSGLVTGHTATVTITGSQTVVGESDNTITKVVVKNASGADVTANYNVTKVSGTLTVTAKSISGLDATLSKTEVEYDGTAKEPTVTVKDGNKTLVAGTDYTVNYTSNTNAGTATVTITGKGNYEGEIEKTFEITKRKITVTSSNASKVYDGNALTNNTYTISGSGLAIGHTVTVTIAGSQTIVGESDNTITKVVVKNASGADVTANYNVTKVNGTLTVTAQETSNIKVDLSQNSFEYDGTAKEPTVTVTNTSTNKTLVAGTDYDVSYTNNVNAGNNTAKVIITLKGNYSGTITKTFTITQRAITITAGSASKVYDGIALTNNTYTIGGSGLATGHTATVTITGSQTVVGESDNTITKVVVKNASGVDVTSNYAIITKTGKLSVTAQTVDNVKAELSESTFVYDGTAKEPTIIVTNTSINKTLVAGTDYNVSYTNNVNAGSNTAKVVITLKGNYSGTITKTFTITQRAITITAGSASKVYDGSALTNSSYTITGSGLATGHTSIVTITGSQTVVGSSPNIISSVVIKDASENNVTTNYDITKVNGTLEVTSKGSGVTAELATLIYTYDGLEKKPGVTVKDGTTPLVEGTDYNVKYDDNVNVGTAKVTITLKGNYSGTITKTFAITHRAITITSSSASKVYDGNSLTNSSYTITGSGLATGHTATVTITGSQTVVGENANTITSVVIKDASGADVTANYNVTKVSGTLTVTAKSISGLDATLSETEVEYDGTAKEPTVTVTNTSTNKTLEKETDYDVAYQNNVNAGSNTAKVIITLKGNYSGTITKTFTITQRAITITAGSASKVYDGIALTNNTYTIGGSGLATGHTATVTITGSQTVVGESDNTITKVVIKNASGADVTANYNVTKVNGTLTVTAQETSNIKVDLSQNSFEYDGTAKEPTVTVTNTLTNKTLEKDTDYEVAYQNNVNAGSNTAKVTITLKGNYSGTITKTFTITQRAITITAGSASKVYDGNALTNNTYTIGGSGLAQGHIVTVTITGSQTVVGSSPNTISTVVIKDASGNNVTGNYDITTTAGTLTITAKSISGLDATLSETEVEYDGTAKEPTVTVKDGNKTLVVGTDYTVNYTSNTNAGTATVTITGKGNYEGEIEKTFEITKRKITVTAESATKVYDGTELTNSNYTIGGSGLATGHTVTVTITGSQTVVGSSPNTISSVVIKDTSGNNVTINYDITKVNGTLEVTSKGSGVTAELAALIYTYDGLEKKPGATVKDGITPLVEGTDYNVKYDDNVNVGTAKVIITLKGNYSGTITKTFAITHRAITITAGSAGKVYDGTALTNNNYTIGGSGLATGHTETITITGSQTVVGSSPNTISSVLIKDGNGADVTSNYAVTTTAGTLTVTAKSISGLDATLSETEVEYDGTAKELKVTIKDGDKTLEEGTDYDVKYDDNKDAGTATVTITGKGNYEGEIEKTFEITKRKITVTSSSASKVYDGTALTNNNYTISGSGLATGHTETVTITGSQTIVGESSNTITDVVINDASGTIVTSNYAVTTTAGTLTVTSKSISGLDATLSESEVEYDGTAKEPTVTVKDGNKTLVAGTDYTVNYTSNTNAGTATVTITGKGNYQGEIEKTFEITKRKITITAGSAGKVYDGNALTNNTYTIGGSGLATGHTETVTITGSQTIVGESANTITSVVIKDASGANVTANYNVTKVNGTLTVTAQETSNIKVDLSQNSFEYDGTAKEPTVTVTNTLTNKTLEKDTDYNVSYTNNVNAGSNTAKVTITLKGNYSGTITKTFTITPRAITITAGSASKVYDGAALTNNNYTISGSGLATGHTETVTITGSQTIVGESSNTITDVVINDASGTNVTSNYVVTTTAGTLTVTSKSISGLDATLSESEVEYDGTAKEPKVTIKDGTTPLVEGTDYDVKYDDNKDAGTATVTITGKGNYEGKIEKTFEITKRKITVTAGSASKVYDGNALTNNTYTIGGSGLAQGHIVTVTITGSQTVVGSSPNTISTVVIKDTSGNNVTTNYDITKVNGTLEVTSKGSGVTAELAALIYTYDGLEKKPGATVKDGITPLVEGTDYNIEYKNNVNVGTAKVIITLKGNYSGTITKTFAITHRAITITAGSAGKVYDGNALTNNTYTIGGSGLATGHTETVTITGSQTVVGSSPNTISSVLIKDGNGADVTSNYAVTTTAGTLTVTAKSISGLDATLSETEVEYDGTAKEPKVTIKDGDKTLEEGTDYDVKYDDNKDAGTATVTITGKGNYEGEIEKTFEITKRKITVTSSSASKVYDGTALTNNNYTISGSGLATGHTETVTITGSQTIVGESSNTITDVVINDASGTNVTSNYVVTTTAGTLTVTAKSISGLDATLSETKVEYDGTAKEPKVTIKDGDKTLEEGTDYDVKYDDNKDAGTATVTITGKGNYEGEIEKTFEITKRKITVTSSSASKVYDGNALTNNTYTIGGSGLATGHTATVTITGSQTVVGSSPNTISTVVIKDGNGADVTSNYAVTTTAGTLTVAAKSISGLDATLSETEVEYDGTAKEPKVTIKDGDKTLEEGTDYDVKYDDNKDAGTATVTITGKGNYEGEIEKTFEITKRKIIITSLSASKVYDGEPLTNNNYTISGSGLAKGHKEKINISGSQTNVGSSANTIASVIIRDENDENVSDNYEVEKNYGTLTVTIKDISALNVKLNETEFEYDGTSKTPEVTVMDGDRTAIFGVDYEVSYENNVNAGINTAKVTVIMKDNYKGTTVLYFTITQRPITITSNSDSKVYDGTALTNNNYSIGGKDLAENHTSTVTITGSQTSVGESANTITSVVIKDASGKDVTANYEITTVEGTLKVTAKNVSNIDIILEQTEFEYDNTAKEPSVTVSDEGKILKLNKDYTIKYVDNVNAGTAKVIITMTGNYTGVTEKPFTINRRNITVKPKDAEKIYDGLPLTSSESEIILGTLVDGHILTIETTGSQTEIGSSENVLDTVKIVDAQGNDVAKNYNITKENGTLTVKPKITDYTVQLKETYFVYDGIQKRPGVTVRDGDKEMIEGTDYTVSYGDNINAGQGTVTVIGKGMYGGSKTVTFEILPAEIKGNVIIKGVNQVGEILTVDTSDIIPTGCSLSYKWYVNNRNSTTSGTLIDGEITNQYEVKADDVGKYIYVEVTATKTNYKTNTFTDITDSTNNNNATALGRINRKPTIRFEQKQTSPDFVEIKAIIKAVNNIVRISVNNSIVNEAQYRDTIKQDNYEITITLKYEAYVNGVYVFEVEDSAENIVSEKINISTIGTNKANIEYKKYNATYYDNAKIVFNSDESFKIVSPESYASQGIKFNTNYYATEITATISEDVEFNENKTFTFVDEKQNEITVVVEAPIYTKNVYIRMADIATIAINVTVKEAITLTENMVNSKAMLSNGMVSYYGIKGTTNVSVATGNELEAATLLGNASKTSSLNANGKVSETSKGSVSVNTNTNYMNGNVTGVYKKTTGLLDLVNLVTDTLEKYTSFRIVIRP